MYIFKDKREWLTKIAKLSIPNILLAVCFFGTTRPVLHSESFIGSALFESSLFIRSSQDLLFLFAFLCYLSCLFIQITLFHLTKFGWYRELGLFIFICSGAISYLTDYKQASTSLYALSVIAAIVIAKCIGLWIANSISSLRSLLYGILIMLALSSLWSGEASAIFKYRETARFNGLWPTPNIFGMMMSGGLTIGVGLLLTGIKEFPLINKKAKLTDRCCLKHFRFYFLIIALTLLSRGLLISYSRGAWITSALAIGLLLSKVDWENFDWAQKVYSLAIRHITVIWISLFSIFTISYWLFRYTDKGLVRRVFSIFNSRDQSWTNRIDAWEGATRMLLDRPVWGYGWNNVREAYSSYYRPTWLIDGGAIVTNDLAYFGATLGGPAILGYIIYIFYSTRTSQTLLCRFSSETYLNTEKTNCSNRESWLRTVSKIGGASLFFGSIFNGVISTFNLGLFLFLLLELGMTQKKKL